MAQSSGKRYSHRNGETKKPTIDGLFWIKGEAIIREKMWPYNHNQRVEFSDERPYEIIGGSIEMNMDVCIELDWVTAKAQFWGPEIAPWKG